MAVRLTITTIFPDRIQHIFALLNSAISPNRNFNFVLRPINILLLLFFVVVSITSIEFDKPLTSNPYILLGHIFVFESNENTLHISFSHFFCYRNIGNKMCLFIYLPNITLGFSDFSVFMEILG